MTAIVLRKAYRRLADGWLWLSTVGVVWLAMCSTCFAQGQEEESKGKGYVANYLIVVLAVGVVLTTICRSGKRHSEIRQTE